MIAKRIIFTGTVQGVGFRFSAHRFANRHQLTGCVRNLSDGTVEMLAQGAETDIADCIEDLKSNFGSYIRQIKATDLPHDPRHNDFRITF